MDFHESELKMNAYLTDKFAEIIKQMGAREVLKKPRKGPYDITEYQTTHLCGGAIMGTDPKTSAMNRYCQSWDLPAERRLQSNRHAGRAGFLDLESDPRKLPQKSGAACPCVRA